MRTTTALGSEFQPRWSELGGSGASGTGGSTPPVPGGPAPSTALGFAAHFAADAVQVASSDRLDACGAAAQPAGVDAALAPDERYYTTAEMEAWMDDLVKAFPGKAQKLDLSALPGAAKTHRGRSIFALKISADVQTEGDKPAVVIASQHHARELNSPVMSLFAMKRLLEAYGKDPEITNLLDTKEIVIVPCVNPDGVDKVWSGQPMWRKNGRDNGDGTQGVDLNRNYPWLWARCGSSPDKSSEIYRGPSAGSEPETRTMMALQQWLRPELYLDFHSSGREVLTLYPDCATIKPSLAAFGDRYGNDLRGQIGFGYRPPSGSGEAPHYHWSQGTLSYLIEVGTTFQPPFPDTVKEEDNVWKAVRHALINWAPAARGHVTSSDGTPLAAEISVTPETFSNGEKSGSRGRDGRFGLWLPIGDYVMTISAPGHEPQVRRIRVNEYDKPAYSEVVLQKKARQQPALSVAESVQLRRAA